MAYSCLIPRQNNRAYRTGEPGTRMCDFGGADRQKLCLSRQQGALRRPHASKSVGSNNWREKPALAVAGQPRRRRFQVLDLFAGGASATSDYGG